VPAEADIAGQLLDAAAVFVQLLTGQDAVPAVFVAQEALAGQAEAVLAETPDSHDEADAPWSPEDATRRFEPAKTMPAAAITPTRMRDSFARVIKEPPIRMHGLRWTLESVICPVR